MTAVDDVLSFTEDHRNGAATEQLPNDIYTSLDEGEQATGATEAPALVRTSRAVAVAITAAIGVSSFILSFAVLSDPARRTGSWTGWLPYLWPGVVDGAIVLATMGIVVTAAYPDQRKNRQFFWVMLAVGALVSIGGNALHAILPATAPLPAALAFSVACVPPAGILGSTHAVQIMWRLSPSRTSGSWRALQAGQVPAARAHLDRAERWLALAREIHRRGRLTNHSEFTLGQALWRLFEVRPPMSLRAIGEEVGVGHHDVISRIRQTATEVVRDRPELVPTPVAVEGQPGLAS
jgi:hypothetical protein